MIASNVESFFLADRLLSFRNINKSTETTRSSPKKGLNIILMHEMGRILRNCERSGFGLLLEFPKTKETSMHSSRIRTDRALTIFLYCGGVRLFGLVNGYLIRELAGPYSLNTWILLDTGFFHKMHNTDWFLPTEFNSLYLHRVTKMDISIK